METFLSGGDYVKIAKDFLLLVPETWFNYLESKKREYYKANDNMFELIANEIGKIKEAHSIRGIGIIEAILKGNPERVFSVEFKWMRENFRLGPDLGSHSLSSLEYLEKYMINYAEHLKSGEEIERNRNEWPEKVAKLYRKTAVNKAIQSVEEIINKQRGELGKAQFSGNESVESLKGLISFWESELVFHKSRKAVKFEGKTGQVTNSNSLKTFDDLFSSEKGKEVVCSALIALKIVNKDGVYLLKPREKSKLLAFAHVLKEKGLIPSMSNKDYSRIFCQRVNTNVTNIKALSFIYGDFYDEAISAINN